ncbi:MAG: hypothetical protein R2797_00835 [Gelidibacter sp.]
MNPKFRPYRKFFFVIPIAILFAISAIVMWLWNSLLPEIIGVKAITYWQAMGILILSKILFGGFHGCKNRRHGMHRKSLTNKIQNMTPEEREVFRAKWKQRFGKDKFC